MTMKVLLCGGGNAIHVLSAYASSNPNNHVTILSLFPGEADRLRQAMPEEGVRCKNDLGEDVIGRPDAIIDEVCCHIRSSIFIECAQVLHLQIADHVTI